jgi:Ca-activated chloride channel family protein
VDILKRKSTLIIIAITFLTIQTAGGSSFSSLNGKGNKAYKDGLELLQKGDKTKAADAWDEAMKYYRDAEIEKPESYELSYNLGNVMYQQEKYQDALDKYYKSLSADDVKHQAWAYYDLGNTLYRSGKYPESIQAYQKCLELTPDDEDAKYNLEFVRKKMKEMMDKEKQRQENQRQQSQQQNQQQQQQQQQQEEQKKQEQQSQASQSEQEQKKKEEQKQQQQLKPKEGMTKEEAERILNAFKDDEKDMQKKKMQEVQGQGVKGGKDW